MSEPSFSPNRMTSPNGRAKSPLLFNETSSTAENDSLYQQALKKVYEASWRFDRGKDGELLKTLDNKKLPKDLFRQIVRVGMELKLTPQELDALMPLFNNDGNVDGCEFILVFYRLRYEHRSKVFSERIVQQKRAKDTIKYEQKKQLEEQEVKTHIHLIDNFTTEDLDSVMQKIINAAVKYDRLMPGAVQLDAFDCDFMQPNVFREQLKLVFNLNVTMAELSAFIKNFNKDNDHGESINCAAFLVSFFRAGFQERSNRLHDTWKEKKRIEENKKMKELQDRKEQEMRNALKCSFQYTEEDKARAILKLRTAARLYDKTTPGAMSMKAFEVKEMQPHVFKEQLKRIFNLQVTPPEMGALMAVFDVNGDGVITCEEFTKVFLHMGFVEREKELKESMEKQKAAEARRLQLEEEKRIALDNKNNLKVNFTYTEEDMQSAVRKLTEAAWRYDKLMPGAPCLDAFESEHMEPHVLKEQLKKGFYMKVTPPELGAIVHLFDTDNVGKINCEQFLKKFFKTGFDERQRQKVEWREHEKSIAERTLLKKTAKLKAQEDKIAFANVDHTYTEADFQTAFQKLTTGAMKYDRAGPGAMGLNAFEAVSMPPHVFKEQLKLVFNVNITLPELWALVAYFDRDQSGVVNCKHFLTQFLRTGLEERIRIRQTWRKEEEEKRLKDKQKEELMVAEKVKKAWAEVDFEFLEPDFDSMINIFVNMCFNFDRRQLGPAGLSAFQVDSLNPAEFREMLKRTFNLRLTARELGAMVTYFDSRGKKVADCAMFLNAVVQVRVQCEEFKGRPDEEKLKKEYIAQLKEHYRLKMARNPSVDARPWRNNAILAKETNFVKSVAKPVCVAPPATPLEKYKLRISVGKQTGRMDLACKSVWPSEGVSRGLSHSNSVSSMNTSLLLPPHSQPDATHPETSANASVEGGGSDSVGLPTENGAFLTQDGEEVQFTTVPEDKHKSSSFVLEDSGGEEGRPGDIEGDGDGDGEGIFDQVSTARDGDASEAAFAAATLATQLTRTDTSASAVITAGAPGSVGKMNSKGGRSGAKKRRPKEMMLDFRLSVIPREVLKLTELSELWLTNNNITVVPPALGELKQLLVLSLSYNKIETLPAELCQLVNLRKLYLRGNLLATLPNLMGQMSSMVHLDCAYNRYSAFPEVVTAMPRVVHMDFAFNRIPSLPATLEQLQCLVYLNLSDNALVKPQAVLLRMPWLEVLGCPLSVENRGATPYAISLSEEHELTNLIKSRAAASLMAKLRRKKKKPSYL